MIGRECLLFFISLALIKQLFLAERASCRLLRGKHTRSTVVRTQLFTFSLWASILIFSAAVLGGEEDVDNLSGLFSGLSLNDQETWVLNEDDKPDLLIEHLSQNFPGWVYLVHSTDDLHQHQLVTRIRITESGDFERSDGALYSSHSSSQLKNSSQIAVVIDYRKVDRTVDFNELHDESPTFLGKPVTARIFNIISRDMLTESKYGADFWRRIMRTTIHHEHKFSSPSGGSMLLKSLEATTSESRAVLSDSGLQSATVANFAITDDWQGVLIGKPAMSLHGGLTYQSGVITPENKPLPLFFVDPPLNDDRFRAFLYQVKQGKPVEINGRSEVQGSGWNLFAVESSAKVILERLQDYGHAIRPDMVIINGENFDELMAESAITASGTLIQKNKFETCLEDSSGFAITSSLKESQWVRLLLRLNAIRHSDFQLAVADPDQQPPVVQSLLSDFPQHPVETGRHTSVKIGQTSADTEPEVLMLFVQSDIELETLLAEKQLLSERSRTFRVTERDLLQRICNGGTVVLRGLESNPVLQRQLEPLMSLHPCLMVFEKKVCAHGGFHLIIEWPEATATNSLFLGKLLKNAHEEQQKVRPVERAPWLNLKWSNPDIEGQLDLIRHYATEAHSQQEKSAILPASVQFYLESIFELGQTWQSPIPRCDHLCQLKLFRDYSASKNWWQVLEKHIDTLPVEKDIKIFLKALNAFQYPQSGVKTDSSQLFSILAHIANKDGIVELSNDVLTNNFWSFALGSGLVHRNSPLLAGNLLKSEALDLLLNTMEAQLQVVSHRHGRDAATSEMTPLLESSSEPFSVIQLTVEQMSAGSQQFVPANYKRLKHLLAHHPAVLLSGPAGSGKSYLAMQIAMEMTKKKPVVITASSSIKVEELYESPVLKGNEDGDRYIEFEPGPLKKWLNEDSGYLVVEEANTATEKFWHFLDGLLDPRHSPYVFVNGYKVPLKGERDEKKIIFTVNSDSSQGGSRYPWLESAIPTVKLASSEDAVHKTLHNILRHPGREKNAKDFLKKIQALFNERSPRSISVRDRMDILSRLEHRLYYSPLPWINPKPHLRSHLYSAFASSLKAVLDHYTGEPEYAPVMREWLHLNGYPIRDIKKDRYRRHMDALQAGFYEWLHQRNDGLVVESPATHQLVQDLLEDLDRVMRYREGTIRQRGHRATLLEGPPGRGKGMVLGRILEFFKFQYGIDYQQITARSHNLASIIDVVEKAARSGEVVVVHELNTIPSEKLEQFLNPLLDGPAKKYFHLFATINPAEFVGRHEMSPALKDRFRHVFLSDYTEVDYKAIGKKMDQATDTLASWVAALQASMISSGMNIRPVAEDVTTILKQHRDEGGELWKVFARYYRLALNALDVKSPADLSKPVIADQFMPELTRHINRHHWHYEPVVVRKGRGNQVNKVIAQVSPAVESEKTITPQYLAPLAKSFAAMQLRAGVDGTPPEAGKKQAWDTLYTENESKWLQVQENKLVTRHQHPTAKKVLKGIALSPLIIAGAPLVVPLVGGYYLWRNLARPAASVTSLPPARAGIYVDFSSGSSHKKNRFKSNGTKRWCNKLSTEDTCNPSDVVLPLYGVKIDDVVNSVSLVQFVQHSGAVITSEVPIGIKGGVFYSPLPIPQGLRLTQKTGEGDLVWGNIEVKLYKKHLTPLYSRAGSEDWVHFMNIQFGDKELMEPSSRNPLCCIPGAVENDVSFESDNDHVEIYHDHYTGLNYARLVESSPLESATGSLQYVIHIDQPENALSAGAGNHNVTYRSPELDGRFKQWLSRYAQQQKDIVPLFKTADSDQVVKKVAAYLTEFAPEKLQRRDQETVLDYLLRSLQNKTGNCLVRSLIANLILQFHGIEAQLQANPDDTLIRYSFQGQKWTALSLGGSPNNVRYQNPTPTSNIKLVSGDLSERSRVLNDYFYSQNYNGMIRYLFQSENNDWAWEEGIDNAAELLMGAARNDATVIPHILQTLDQIHSEMTRPSITDTQNQGCYPKWKKGHTYELLMSRLIEEFWQDKQYCRNFVQLLNYFGAQRVGAFYLIGLCMVAAVQCPTCPFGTKDLQKFLDCQHFPPIPAPMGEAIRVVEGLDEIPQTDVFEKYCKEVVLRDYNHKFQAPPDLQRLLEGRAACPGWKTKTQNHSCIFLLDMMSISSGLLDRLDSMSKLTSVTKKMAADMLKSSAMTLVARELHRRGDVYLFMEDGNSFLDHVLYHSTNQEDTARLIWKEYSRRTRLTRRIKSPETVRKILGLPPHTFILDSVSTVNAVLSAGEHINKFYENKGKIPLGE